MWKWLTWTPAEAPLGTLVSPLGAIVVVAALVLGDAVSTLAGVIALAVAAAALVVYGIVSERR